MTDRERYIATYRLYIRREGSQKLLEWMTSPSCDFFTAPASTRFHGSYCGGLCSHSMNVYDCLCDYLKNTEVGKAICDRQGNAFSEESIAIVALLHDLCKTNFYKTEKRNVKKNGVWEEVDYFSIDDGLPYGHGEKSVYLIQKFMPLTRDEAFAIRYHMGFSVGDTEERPMIEAAFANYPLAFALFASDAAASYFKEGMPE